MIEPLTVVVPCKNRSRVEVEGLSQPLYLFPRMVSSLRHQCLKEDGTEPVRMLVVDYHSDDWPLREWLPAAMAPYPVEIIDMDGFFSVGVAWNAGAAACETPRMWFLDTDMLVDRRVLSRGCQAVKEGKVYFPTPFGFTNPQWTAGEWRRYGCGNVMMTQEGWQVIGPRPEFDTHGKCDEILLRRAQEAGIAVRERCPGFYHQWHPNTLAWLNRYYAGEHSEAKEAEKLREYR